MLKRINPASIMTPASPYSHGIELPPGTRILYCAGQVGTTKDGTTPSDLVQQNEIAWANIKAVLNDAGMDLKDIVRMNAYLTSREGIEPFRTVRNRMVGKVKPASTLVLVAGLAGPHWHVEIEVVAAQAPRAAGRPSAAKAAVKKSPAKKSAKKPAKKKR